MTKKTEEKDVVTSGFHALGIMPQLLMALDKLKFGIPTPIQHQAIPIALEGKDIVGIAQTGTGKTLAFGIPMIQRLGKADGKGLVILPTRELAIQVDESFKQIGKGLGLRTAVLIGGASIRFQTQELRQNPHVVIATPGRLIDHVRQGTVRLDDASIVVLDEADRMFDMGFAPQINEIIKLLPGKRQTMLFSATMPPQIMAIATKNMALPVRIEIAPSGTSAERIEQEIIIVRKDAKHSLLEKILYEYKGTVLVFSRTKHGARKLCVEVKDIGHTVAEIHSDRSLIQRKEALAGFKSGKYRVLIATDIAARGIDVTGIELVINYDLPDNSEDYVHRVGRTGRAGKEGHAISFATPDQGTDIRDIERLMRKTLSISSHEDAKIYSGKVASSSRSGFGRHTRSFGVKKSGFGGFGGGSRRRR